MIPRAKKRDREIRVVREQRRAGGPKQGFGWAARQARGEGRAKSKAKRTEKKSRTKRERALARRKSQLHAGGMSHYARKVNFLKRYGGWGWQWQEKPWRQR